MINHFLDLFYKRVCSFVSPPVCLFIGHTSFWEMGFWGEVWTKDCSETEQVARTQCQTRFLSVFLPVFLSVFLFPFFSAFLFFFSFFLSFFLYSFLSFHLLDNGQWVWQINERACEYNGLHIIDYKIDGTCILLLFRLFCSADALRYQ